MKKLIFCLLFLAVSISSIEACSKCLQLLRHGRAKVERKIIILGDYPGHLRYQSAEYYWLAGQFMAYDTAILKVKRYHPGKHKKYRK